MPPSYSPCPRPILKRSHNPPPPIASQLSDEPASLLAIDPSILSPLVRFPPSRSLTHTLGRAPAYDRSPIVVLPNSCALPERGCPGRTYASSEDLHGLSRSPPRASSSRRVSPSNPNGGELSPRGKHFHPKLVDIDEAIRTDDDPTPRQTPLLAPHHPLPALVPDLSSESSEESDCMSSPPPELYGPGLGPSKPVSLDHQFAALALQSKVVTTGMPHALPLTQRFTHPAAPRTIPYYPSSSPTAVTGDARTGRSSPVRARSRSPASPTHTKRRSSKPIAVPTSHTSSYPAPPSSPPAYSPSNPSLSGSPERTRTREERHRDRAAREERHRERREREEEVRERNMAKYRSMKSFGGGFAVEDAGCLGGF